MQKVESYSSAGTAADSDMLPIVTTSASIAANPMLPAVESGTLRPILFSAPMVQAILSGRKTQTRRIIKPQPDDSGLWNHDKFPMSLDSELNGWWGTVDETGESKEFNCPFGWGGSPYLNNSLLWVRETCYYHKEEGRWIYKASEPLTDSITYGYKWKPSIFMPLAACRIFLKVKNVRVERLQDISEKDAEAEGVFIHSVYPSPRMEYASLWEKINGKGSWDKNPFVWVIEFERCVHP